MNKSLLLSLILLLLVFPFVAAGQETDYEISGTITGTYQSKMYLFFEGNFRKRDSISSEIINGRFSFKGKVKMPVLAHLHMDQRSLIEDVYIDGKSTQIVSTSHIQIHPGNDTLNELRILKVNGSSFDMLRTNFEKRIQVLNAARLTDTQKKEKYYQYLLSFIKNHPNSKLSPYLLGKAYTLSFKQVMQLTSLLDTMLTRSYEMKSVTALLKRLDKSINRQAGTAFYDFKLKDSSGHEIDSRQFRGKYLLVVCWASWCGPCRKEHPDLKKIFEVYRQKDFAMVGLSLDKDAVKWKQAIIKDQIQWLQVIEPKEFNSELADFYDITAIPTNFLIDKEGKILAFNLDLNQLEVQLRKIFEQ